MTSRFSLILLYSPSPSLAGHALRVFPLCKVVQSPPVATPTHKYILQPDVVAFFLSESDYRLLVPGDSLVDLLHSNGTLPLQLYKEVPESLLAAP